mgnify:CR=1 FL=1
MRRAATNPDYRKPWDSLTDDQRSSIKSYIQTNVRESAPELDAWLAWWGKYTVIQTLAAGDELRRIRKQYGREPVDERAGPVRYADNAR